MVNNPFFLVNTLSLRDKQKHSIQDYHEIL